MKIIFSEKCLGYEFPGYPESALRLKQAVDFLKKNKYEFIEPSSACEDDLLAVHTRTMINKVKSGENLDIDTPNSKEIFKYTLLSCGAAILAQKLALSGENVFSLMRPHGHHAGRNSSAGFCYFNNMAVAVSTALKTVSKIAIIDIDCHHGNGTEDIFIGNEKVLFVSLHRSPFYPGTGLKSIRNCINFQLSKRTTNEVRYLKALGKALKYVEKFNPNLIAVSAGFDTYKEDPIGGLGLTKISYHKISEIINNLNKPTFSILEGGYGNELGECIQNYLDGFKKFHN